MPLFSATDAIFFGFRVVKRDPVMLAVLAVLALIVGVVSTQLIWRDLVAFMTVVQEFQQLGPEASEAEAMRLLGAYADFFLAPGMLLAMLMAVVLGLITQGAILRNLVRDRREGWILGLQLGGDELRILVVSLVIAIAMFALYVACILIVSILAGVLGAVSVALGVMFGLIAAIAAALGLLLIATRLSVAAPASVGEKKFVVLGSWHITRGHMWGLLGAYVVLFFIIIVASLILFVVQSALTPQAMALMQGMTPATAMEDVGAAFRSPGYILVTALSSGLNVVITAAWSGVGAYAYRMLGAGAGYANAQPPQEASGAPA